MPDWLVFGAPTFANDGSTRPRLSTPTQVSLYRSRICGLFTVSMQAAEAVALPWSVTVTEKTLLVRAAAVPVNSPHRRDKGQSRHGREPPVTANVQGGVPPVAVNVR